MIQQRKLLENWINPLINNFKRRLIGFIFEWGLPLFLLACVSILGAYSIDLSHWLNKYDPLSLILIEGVLFGVLLSYTRWNSWIISIYALVIGFFIIVQSTGNIFLPVKTIIGHPLDISATEMNIRLFVFVERFLGWIGILQNGKNVQDTGLFIIIIGILVWISCIWMAVWIIRSDQILIGLLPFGLLLAINIYLSKQSIIPFLEFLIIAICLIANKAYSSKKREWNQRTLDYPSDFMDWPASVLTITIVLAIFIYLFPIIATPEGRQKLTEFTRNLREKQAQTAEKLFAKVNPPRIETEPTLTTNVPGMGTIGAPIPNDPRIIMYVHISDPPPVLPDNVPFSARPPLYQHYWRSEVYSYYNGLGWEPPPTQPVENNQLANDAPQITPPPGRYKLDQKYEIIASNSGPLFGVNNTFHVDTGILANHTIPDQSVLLSGDVANYQISSWATKISSTLLKNDIGEVPELLHTTYLQLPENLPIRVRNLANKLTDGVSSPYDKAIIIQDYLRSNYKYDPIVKPPPQGQDAVDYFLFESQAGFCSYFSSAMVVLLRASDVPARVATGYAMGSYDSTHQAFGVQANAAHAWVEVYFPNYGWIEFEPTPIRSTFIYPQDLDKNTIQTTINNSEGNVSNIGLLIRWVIRFFAVVMVLIILQLWRKGIFHNLLANDRIPSEKAQHLYQQIRMVCNWIGLKAGGNITPNEFLDIYKPILGDYPRLKEAIMHATSIYVLAAYSPDMPSEAQFVFSKKIWYRAWIDVIRMWFRIIINKQN